MESQGEIDNLILLNIVALVEVLQSHFDGDGLLSCLGVHHCHGLY